MPFVAGDQDPESQYLPAYRPRPSDYECSSPTDDEECRGLTKAEICRCHGTLLHEVFRRDKAPEYTDGDRRSRDVRIFPGAHPSDDGRRDYAASKRRTSPDEREKSCRSTGARVQRSMEV